MPTELEEFKEVVEFFRVLSLTDEMKPFDAFTKHFLGEVSGSLKYFEHYDMDKASFELTISIALEDAKIVLNDSPELMSSLEAIENVFENIKENDPQYKKEKLRAQLFGNPYGKPVEKTAKNSKSNVLTLSVSTKKKDSEPVVSEGNLYGTELIEFSSSKKNEEPTSYSSTTTTTSLQIETAKIQNLSEPVASGTAFKLSVPDVPRLVRGIQKSRSMPESLDPADKPRDVGSGLNLMAVVVSGTNPSGTELIEFNRDDEPTLFNPELIELYLPKKNKKQDPQRGYREKRLEKLDNVIIKMGVKNNYLEAQSKNNELDEDKKELYRLANVKATVLIGSLAKLCGEYKNNEIDEEEFGKKARGAIKAAKPVLSQHRKLHWMVQLLGEFLIVLSMLTGVGYIAAAAYQQTLFPSPRIKTETWQIAEEAKDEIDSIAPKS